MALQLPNSEQPDRETLLETYGKNPLKGLAKTATMFMPDWLSGVPRNELSLGDTVKSMIEFTPVVGDVMDLKEGADFQNDLDPLERGLAIFAGLGAVGAGVHIANNSYTTMRQRYIQDIKGMAVTPVATDPAPAGERPIIQMKEQQEDFDSIRRTLVEKSRKGSRRQIQLGEKEKRFVYTEGGGAPRHVQISVAETLTDLHNAIYSKTKSPQKIGDNVSRRDSAFAGFVWQLGTLVLHDRGVDASQFGTFDEALMTSNTESALETEEGVFGLRIPPELLEAATEALSIFSQIYDAELINDVTTRRSGNRLFGPLGKDGDLFLPESTEGEPDAFWSFEDVGAVSAFISDLADITDVVKRHSSGDIRITPNMQWNSFYRTSNGRMQGNLNIHIMPDSRYVDVENGAILDPEGLEQQLWRLDWETVIPQMVLNLLSINEGGTSVAVNDVHRAKAKEWYPQFNKLINVISERYGVTPIQAGAIISALSPRAAWDPDNVNWGILGVFEATTGITDEIAQLNELNEVRQLAGFAPVTRFKSFGSALSVGQGKVAELLEGKNPVEVLRMLKTMSFLHNGLFPEGTAADSPFGVQVITADTHHFRAISGFFHAAEAPWMRQGRDVTKQEQFWESGIGLDLKSRTGSSVEGLKEAHGISEFVPEGLAVPHSVAEKTYDAITRATVIAAEILGIKPIEAQAMFWQPVQEAGVSGGGTLGGAKTAVWNDAIIKEIEGRSSTSPSLTDALSLIDSKLIDPMTSDLDIFTVADVHNYEPDVGILIASSSTGIRIYADPSKAGVADQLRTARPINAEPVLLKGKKEGLEWTRSKPTATKANPIRWVARKSRKANLGVVTKGMFESAPASEVRTITDPSVMENIPDVHAAGNFIVVEVEQGGEGAVNKIINEMPLPYVTSVQVPITIQSAGRSSYKMSSTELEAGLGSKPSNNPLINNNWVMVPQENQRLIGTLRRKGYSITPAYMRVGDQVEQTWLIMGIDESTKGLDSFSRIWTQDAMFDNIAGTMTPSEGGVNIGREGGTEFSVLTEKGGEDFSIEYDESMSVPAVQENVSTSGAEAKSSKRTQIIISLGSTADPGMVNNLWKSFDADGSVVSLSGYFHGKLWTDASMQKVGEYSYTNGQERITQRAQHNPLGLTDENYYDVWVPKTEANSLSHTHGAFATKGNYGVKVERKSDQSSVIDGETQIFSVDGVLEVNPENIFQSTVDGQQIEEIAIITTPTGERRMVVGQEGKVAYQVMSAFGKGMIQPPAIFSLTATGKIKDISNDALQVPKDWTSSKSIKDIGAHFAKQPSWEFGTAHSVGEAQGKGRGLDAVEKGREQLPTASPYDMGVYDPAYVTEINDLLSSIEFLVRYGASSSKISGLLKNHPLGAALSSRWSPIGLLTASSRTGSKATRAYTMQQFESWINQDFSSFAFADDPDLISSGHDAFIDAHGVTDSANNPEAQTMRERKQSQLSPEKQAEYKALAAKLIGDYSIFPDYKIPLLAGYLYPQIESEITGKGDNRLNEAREKIVLATIQAIGALTERPGFTPTNPLSNLPGIKKFREKHGGIVFPGVALLAGSITIGAKNSAFNVQGQSEWGGVMIASYLSEGRSDTSGDGPIYDLTHSGNFALDEDGNPVYEQGIHLSVEQIMALGDMEYYLRGIKYNYVAGGNKIRYVEKLQKTNPEAILARTMIHEFGHAVHGALSEIGRGHTLREGMDRIVQSYGGVGVVYREIGRYASSSWRELFAESFTDVMLLGDDAHPMAHDLVELAHQLLYSEDVGPIRKEIEQLSSKQGLRSIAVAQFNKKGEIKSDYLNPYDIGAPNTITPFWQYGITARDYGRAGINSVPQKHGPWRTIFHYLEDIGRNGGETSTSVKTPIRRIKTKKTDPNFSKKDWESLR